MARPDGPTLADQFLAARQDKSSLFPPAAFKRVQARMRDARRFVMDADATQRFAQVVRDVPDLVAQNQEFARAPFDLMWVEFPFRAFYAQVTGREPDATSDESLGYLIDHGDVYSVGRSGGSTVVMPIVYRLHDPWQMDDELRFCTALGVSRMQIDSFFWGEVHSRLNPDLIRSLRAVHSARILAEDRYQNLHPEVFRTVANGSAGDLRNIVALLLLLNRPSVTRYVRDVQRSRGFIRGRLSPFMSHTIINIDLDPVPAIRRIGQPSDAGTPKRRHEVRGHYCHNDAARTGSQRGCVHAWTADHGVDEPAANDSEMLRWRCAACGGKRWWRHAHERGDAGRGFANQDRQITARAA